MQEVCVISVVCEMLSLPHKFNLTANEATIEYLSMPRTIGSYSKVRFLPQFQFSISGVVYIRCWIQEVCVISVLCEMLSNPINSTLQLMKLQLNILACLGPLVHNLKSDFSISFSFSISGVIYIGRWMQEVCVISVVCEMLSNPINSTLQLMKLQLNILAYLGPSVHTLKSDFSLSFNFSITGVVYIRCWIQEVCVISVVCEMLSYPIDSTLQQMKKQLDILACLRASAHNLKSHFSRSFSLVLVGSYTQDVGCRKFASYRYCVKCFPTP